MISTNIQGVIFDLDGTLVTSSLDFKLLRSLIGCPDSEDLLAHLDDLPADAYQKAIRLIEHHEMEDAIQAGWINGAQDFVFKLLNQKTPMAIVTRNFSKAAALKISRNNIPIETVITREDAPAKPDPTALIMIAEQWNIPPANLIYVGDYLYDIQAAKNAGMHACLYVEEQQPEYAIQADIVCRNFDHLYEQLKAL